MSPFRPFLPDGHFDLGMHPVVTDRCDRVMFPMMPISGFCPKGVGAWLASDLPGTGNEPTATDMTYTPHQPIHGRFPPDRLQAGLLRLRQKPIGTRAGF
jgi:hypothetical protein